MMAQAKRIYILMIKVNTLAFFYIVAEFSNRKYVLCVSIRL